MGLIHWWPLNGDTYDYGSNPKHGSIIGTANVTTAGKLGNCLSAGSGTQVTAGVDVANCNLVNELTGKNYSFACWFKVHGTHVHYNGTIMSSGNWNSKSWAVGISQTNNQIDAFTNGYNKWVNIGYTLTNDKWYHLVSVQKDSVNYVYLDGNLLGSVSQSPISQSDATNLCIGRETYASGHFSFNGDICDIRVYDHALSEAEIHELKSGLLVHYNFEDYTGSVNLKTDPNNWTSSYSCDGSGATKGSFTAQSDGSVLVVDNNTNTRFYSSQRIPVKVGDKLTFSIKYKLVSGTGETFRWQISEWNSSGTRVKLWWSQDAQKVKDLGDGWKLYYYHFTVGASDAAEIRFYLQDGADYTNYTHSYYLKDFKLEREHTDNPIFETVGYSTEYDCSGNEHNATVNGVQNKLEAVTGAHSAYFLNGGQWLEHTGAAFSTSTLSVAFWWKSSCAAAKTGYHIPFAIDAGRVEISIPNNGQLRWGGYINGSRQCNNVTCKDANGGVFSLNNGKWHHIVSVFDGTGFLGYVDGVYQGKQGGSGTISYAGKTLRIGKYNAGETSDYGATDAYISDVRVYNTALNTDDIARLYKHTVKVTPEQNLIGEYFIEQNSELDYYTPSTWKLSGWGGDASIVTEGVQLNAYNGWKNFALLTPNNLLNQNLIFSFDYKWTGELPSMGAWVWQNTTNSYTGAIQDLIRDNNIWHHCTVPIPSAKTYVGIMIRGTDESGINYPLIVRNISLQPVTNAGMQVYPTGCVHASRYGDSNKTRIIKGGISTANDFIEQ